MGYTDLLSQMIENNKKARADMNFKSGPPTLRYKGKTSGMCPFTQWYCNPVCALATQKDSDSAWTCSLGRYNRSVIELD